MSAPEYIDIVLAVGEDSDDHGSWEEFVEIENQDGASVRIGEDVSTKDQYRRIRIRRTDLAPERIETREQLDALIYEDVVRDARGFVYERFQGEPNEPELWARPGEPDLFDSRDILLPAERIYRVPRKGGEPDIGERPSGAGDPVLPRGEILTEEPPASSVVQTNDGTEWVRHLTPIFDGWIRPTFDRIQLRSWAQLAAKEPRLISTPTTDAEEAAR